MHSRRRWFAVAVVLAVLGVVPVSPALSASATSTPPAKPAAGPPLAVDPPARDGRVHHPLMLQTHTNGITATPLLSSSAPSG